MEKMDLKLLRANREDAKEFAGISKPGYCTGGNPAV